MFYSNNAWRFLFPSARQYSLFSPLHQSYSRIDYFFIDKRLLPMVKNCSYDAIIISDHCPLIMELYFENQPTPSRSWRCNTYLLSDETFIKCISSEIDIFFEINIDKDMKWSSIWESIKAYIRGKIISYSSFKNKQGCACWS